MQRSAENKGGSSSYNNPGMLVGIQEKIPLYAISPCDANAWLGLSPAGSLGLIKHAALTGLPATMSKRQKTQIEIDLNIPMTREQ